MIAPRAALRAGAAVALAFVLAGARSAAQTPSHRVEFADGTILPGSFPPGAELVLETGAGDRATTSLALLERVILSSVERAEASPGLEALDRLIERLGSEDHAIREQATEDLARHPHWVQAVLTRQGETPDPEVEFRVRWVLDEIERSGGSLDPRDLWTIDGAARRGWVDRGRLPFRPTLGDEVLELELGTVRSILRLDRADDPAGSAAGLPPGDPPAAVEPGDGRVAVVLLLEDGTRLVGKKGSAGAFTGLELSTVRDVVRLGGALVARRQVGGEPFEVRPAAPDLDVTAVGRPWCVPVDALVRLGLGPLEDFVSTLTEYVQDCLDGRPARRFWVRIDDQPSNPWNTATGSAMTWIVNSVEDDRCLVGVDGSSDAYRGDTSVDSELPILCIRPEAGGLPSIRLTSPVRGDRLTSPEEADRIVAQEFGEGWRMAEFHDHPGPGRGGWRFWGRWK